MADLNTNAPYTGAVQYATVGNAAPGYVTGGNYDIPQGLTPTNAIGMLRSVHGGLIVPTVSIECHQPLLARLSGMLRASSTSSVTAVDIVCGNQDTKWTLSSAQPSGFTVHGAVGEPLTATLGYQSILAAPSTTGSSQSAPSSPITDLWYEIDCAIDSTGYHCQSFDITLNTNPIPYGHCDTKSSSKRFPTAILLGAQDVTLALTLAKQLPTAGVIADAFHTDFDIVITGPDAVFTFSDLCQPDHSEGLMGDSGLVTYTYNFTAAKQLGVLAITAGAG